MSWKQGLLIAVAGVVLTFLSAGCARQRPVTCKTVTLVEVVSQFAQRTTTESACRVTDERNL